MVSCDRCWVDAGGDPDEHRRLVDERNENEQACSFEDQAGPDATVCMACGHKTVHQPAGVCVRCGI